MEDIADEGPVLQHIEELVCEEHALLGKDFVAEPQLKRLRALQVELDQLWDLLRQRRAAREIGRDPGNARVRSPEVVEKYTG